MTQNKLAFEELPASRNECVHSNFGLGFLRHDYLGMSLGSLLVGPGQIQVLKLQVFLRKKLLETYLYKFFLLAYKGNLSLTHHIAIEKEGPQPEDKQKTRLVVVCFQYQTASKKRRKYFPQVKIKTTIEASRYNRNQQMEKQKLTTMSLRLLIGRLHLCELLKIKIGLLEIIKKQKSSPRTPGCTQVKAKNPKNGTLFSYKKKEKG